VVVACVTGKKKTRDDRSPRVVAVPRNRDFSGYNFWLAKLNQFNGNYINAEMVKAFLSSIEYRQRFGLP
jgi:hypothetical protein